VITSITTMPNPVAPGNMLTVTVNAFHPLGNTLHYVWLTSNGWNVTGYGATATVTPPMTYNAYGYITVTVSDDYNESVNATIGVETTSLNIASPLLNSAILDDNGTDVALFWDAVPNAVAYNIYHNTNATGTYNKVATTNNTNYDITNLFRTSSHYFVITSVDANGNESGYSNALKAIPVKKYTYGSGGTFPIGIALDAYNNVWVANTGSNTVTKLMVS